MIAPTPFFTDRGCHIRIYEEAAALQRRGHTVKIVAYHIGETPADMDVERTLTIPWYHKHDAGPSWHKLYIDLLLLFKSIAVNRRFRADIVHGHLHEGCFVGWFVSRLFGIPLVFDFQGSLTEEISGYGFIGKRGPLHAIFHFFESVINRMPDKILVATSSSRTLLEEKFGVAPARIGTLLDGTNTNIVKPTAPDLSLMESLDIPQNKRIVAYVGSFSELEGIDTLLQAAKIVVQKNPDAFFLIGGYPHVEKYRAMAQGLGLDGHALLPGRIAYKEVPRYINLGELTVTAKPQTEANGKLYFYMACAKPTVAFDHAINREILGDLGLYPKEQAAEAFADSILEALRKPPESLRELGTRSRERMVQLFSWDARAEEMEREYAGLCAGAGFAKPNR